MSWSKLRIREATTHSDYAPFIHDLRFTNGHASRHIAPMEHVETLAQVGIRSRPAIPLTVLSDEARMSKFLGALDWFASQVREIARL